MGGKRPKSLVRYITFSEIQVQVEFYFSTSLFKFKNSQIIHTKTKIIWSLKLKSTKQRLYAYAFTSLHCWMKNKCYSDDILKISEFFKHRLKPIRCLKFFIKNAGIVLIQDLDQEILLFLCLLVLAHRGVYRGALGLSPPPLRLLGKSEIFGSKEGNHPPIGV